jgi:hypothetical protein
VKYPDPKELIAADNVVFFEAIGLRAGLGLEMDRGEAGNLQFCVDSITRYAMVGNPLLKVRASRRAIELAVEM